MNILHFSHAVMHQDEIKVQKHSSISFLKRDSYFLTSRDGYCSVEARNHIRSSAFEYREVKSQIMYSSFAALLLFFRCPIILFTW